VSGTDGWRITLSDYPFLGLAHAREQQARG
jgi:hypothetical protein